MATLEEVLAALNSATTDAREVLTKLPEIANTNGDVPFTFADGTQITLPGLPKLKAQVDGFIAGAETTIKGWWKRSFYVDAVNGDDNNPGTSNAPFKTLKKAVDNIPIGGYGKIHIIGDYTMDYSFTVLGKRIAFYSDGNLIFPARLNGDYNEFTAHIDVVDSSLYFAVGKIITEVADSSKNWRGSNKVAIRQNVGSCGSRALGRMNVIIDTKCQNDVNVVELHGGILIGNQDLWGSGDVVPVHVGIKRYDYTGTSYILKDGGFLLGEFGVASFVVDVSSYIAVRDSSGNKITWGDVIQGIVTDSNGVPRNIVSNILL